MNYVQWHIGDWVAGTSLLSATERGVYMDLMMRYYSAERPITQDECKRIARAYSEDEQEAMQYVLQTFFTLENGVYVHERCEREIASAKEVSSKRSAASRARWAKKEPAQTAESAPDVQDATKEEAPVKQAECKCNASAILTINHKPLTINTPPLTPPQGEDATLFEGDGEKVEPTETPSKPKQEPRGTRLAETELPDAWREFCEAEDPELDPDRVFANFQDYWAGVSGASGVKRDWFATWRNNVRSYRNAPDWKRKSVLRSAPVDPKDEYLPNSRMKRQSARDYSKPW